MIQKNIIVQIHADTSFVVLTENFTPFHNSLCYSVLLEMNYLQSP